MSFLLRVVAVAGLILLLSCLFGRTLSVLVLALGIAALVVLLDRVFWRGRL